MKICLLIVPASAVIYVLILSVVCCLYLLGPFHAAALPHLASRQSRPTGARCSQARCHFDASIVPFSSYQVSLASIVNSAHDMTVHPEPQTDTIIPPPALFRCPLLLQSRLPSPRRTSLNKYPQPSTPPHSPPPNPPSTASQKPPPTSQNKPASPPDHTAPYSTHP